MKSFTRFCLFGLVVHIAVPSAAMARETPEPKFVSGVNNAEDLLRLDGTPWVVASNFNLDVTSGSPPTRYGFGPLQAIHIDTHEVRRLYPSAESAVNWDWKTYPGCSDPPQSISTHGLGVRSLGKDKFRLYAVNHGGRHSVEIIDVALKDQELRATWRGCVVVPVEELGVWPNGIAALPGEGFIVSGYSVATWRSGRGWEKFESFEGSKPGVPGGPGYGNGVEMSPDGKWIFIADGKRQAVLRFPRGGGKPTAIKISIGADNETYRGPDNLRWGEDGRLYAAAPIFPKAWWPNVMDNFKECFLKPLCVTGTSVFAIDPKTLTVEELVRDTDGFNGRHGLTATALPVGNDLWLTSERSDSLAIVPLRPR